MNRSREALRALKLGGQMPPSRERSRPRGCGSRARSSILILNRVTSPCRPGSVYVHGSEASLTDPITSSQARSLSSRCAAPPCQVSTHPSTLEVARSRFFNQTPQSRSTGVSNTTSGIHQVRDNITKLSRQRTSRSTATAKRKQKQRQKQKYDRDSHSYPDRPLEDEKGRGGEEDLDSAVNRTADTVWKVWT